GVLKEYDTVSSKWLERSVRRRNDFTLENQFSLGASAPPLNRTVADPLRLTPILLQTPDLFAVAPPWHLSLFDRWLLDANVVSRGPAYGVGRLLGTWPPFFYK